MRSEPPRERAVFSNGLNLRIEPTAELLPGHFAGDDFIDIAPDPFFSWLDRAHYGMAVVVKVFGGVLVLGGIAAAHMATYHAHAQVDPGVAEFYAFSADVRVGGGDFNLIEMLALG